MALFGKKNTKDEQLSQQFEIIFGVSLSDFALNSFNKSLLIGVITSLPFIQEKAADALKHCGEHLNTVENIAQLQKLNQDYHS